MTETTDGLPVRGRPTSQPTRHHLLDEMAADARRRWSHLSDEEYQLLQDVFDDPRNRLAALDDGFVEPIIGWSVTFPKDGSLAELLFRSEVAARQAAAAIPGAVVSAFSTPDASWHRWEEQP